MYDYECVIDKAINYAIPNQHFVIAIIDDFTTIHSHRRPDSQMTSDTKCMCTVVLKDFLWHSSYTSYGWQYLLGS